MGQFQDRSDWACLNLHQASGNQPKYERLKTYFMAELASGRLRPGDPLPAEQRLAKTLKVARNTVRQAMAELVRDGLIHRVPGKGTFVDEQVRARLNRGLEVFAMITPETGAAFYLSLLDGFESAASRINHQTLIGQSRNDVNLQAGIILQLLDKNVAGVAMVPTSVPTPVYQIRQLQERGIAVVFCHRAVEDISAPALLLPFRDQGRTAGEALIRHGHRNVAILTFGGTEKYTEPHYVEMVMAAFRDAVLAGGGKVCDECPHLFPFSSTKLGEREEEVFEFLQRLCCRPDRPTAIVATFDNLAELLFLQLGQLGLRVPEDISLVGFGDANRRGTVVRQLTSVTVDEREVGQRAAELLHEMRSGERPIDDDERIMVPLGFAEGRTLGPPPSELKIPQWAAPKATPAR